MVNFDRLDAKIVQKYGGTSVGSVERIHAVAERIAAQKDAGYKHIAVVASAMAGETNRLVDLVHKVDPQPAPELVDMAASAGEQVSIALLAAALRSRGVLAKPFLGFQLGIKTDERHAQAKIQAINTESIQRLWDEGGVPIIAGFQGVSSENEITTLGRGGSDTSAVALAAAVGADVCEINTDVDGFYSADPRFVNRARLIEKMDFAVALELAALGSKVLHSRCVELAAKYELPLIVRSSFQSESKRRTIVMKYSNQESLEAPVVSGVTVERDIARVTLKGLSKQAGLISSLFGRVASEGINVDIIVHNRSEDEETMRLGFTTGGRESARCESVLASLIEPGEFGDVRWEVEKDLAKVSVVGLGMANHHGVASRAFASLTSKGIDIKMISTSEIKISCVVESGQADRSVELMHAEFCEENR